MSCKADNLVGQETKGRRRRKNMYVISHILSSPNNPHSRLSMLLALLWLGNSQFAILKSSTLRLVFQNYYRVNDHFNF